LVWVLTLFVVGGGITFSRFQRYNRSTLVDGAEYSVTGIAEKVSVTTDGWFVVVGNVYADDEKVDGKIYAYIHKSSGDLVEAGKAISFTASLTRYQVFADGAFFTKAVNNVKYECAVYYGVTTSYHFDLFTSTAAILQNVINQNMDEDSATVATALLTGNTDLIEDGTLQSFRYGGLAHLFAVSGLHIGILFAVCIFVCKRLRLMHGSEYILSFVICLFYAGLCGFSPSSLRALIMLTVASFSKLFLRKYDGLNSLAVSVFLLLLINPFYLFTVGFTLSVMSVAGYYLLFPQLKLLFAKLPEKVGSRLSAVVAFQLGTLPIMLTTFGYISWAGLFFNAVGIPFFSALYVVLLAFTFFSVIISPLAPYLMQVAGIPINFLMSAITSSGLENTVLRVGGVAWFTPLCITLFVLLSDKINLTRKVRATLCSSVCVVMAALMVFSAYSPLGGVEVRITSYYDGECVFFSYRGNTVAVFSDSTPASSYQRAVNAYAFRTPREVVVLGGDDVTTVSYDLIADAQTIYFSKSVMPLFPESDKDVVYSLAFTLYDMQFSFIDSQSIVVHVGNVSVGITLDEQNPISQCDLLISRYAFSEGAETFVTFAVRDMQYNIYDYGSLLFVINHDKIVQKGLLPLSGGSRS
jgi:ComEC/Rec2-related protein